jgi:hypothetical protein
MRVSLAFWPSIAGRKSLLFRPHVMVNWVQL